MATVGSGGRWLPWLAAGAWLSLRFGVVDAGEVTPPPLVAIRSDGVAVPTLRPVDPTMPRLVPIPSRPAAPGPAVVAISSTPRPVAIRVLPIEPPVPLRGSPVGPLPPLPPPGPPPIQMQPRVASLPREPESLSAVDRIPPAPPLPPPSVAPSPSSPFPTAANVVPLPTPADALPRQSAPPTPTHMLPPPLPVPPAPAPATAIAPPVSAGEPSATMLPSLPASAEPANPVPAPAPPAPAETGGRAASSKPADAILVGSFNIQVFGESKIAKHQVVDVLARVVRGLDVVAIQEVRAKSDNVIPQFLSAINADGSRYQYVIGPRLGRTVSKEQYCFIYDTTRIDFDPTSVGTVPNPGDRLHRPPLHARFRVRTNPPAAGFSFWLVDIHTDPDEVPQEVDALADVFQQMRSLRADEDDVILLGDLNAAPPQFGRIRQIPGIGWAVSGVTTNTRRSKTYDNIIFDKNATAEFTGRWGVVDLQETFGLPLDKALEVSDHNPVWAAFAPWEARGLPATAAAPDRSLRE